MLSETYAPYVTCELLIPAQNTPLALAEGWLPATQVVVPKIPQKPERDLLPSKGVYLQCPCPGCIQ